MDGPRHFLLLCKNEAKISGLWVQLTSPADVICMVLIDKWNFDVMFPPMTLCDPPKVKQ